jgi:hypothetical protein
MNPVICKVFYEDCPVCAAMEEVEQEAKRIYGAEFARVSFDQIIHYENLYYYLTENVTEDGELDLPCYVLCGTDGKGKAHLTGRLTVEELGELHNKWWKE